MRRAPVLGCHSIGGGKITFLFSGGLSRVLVPKNKSDDKQDEIGIVADHMRNYYALSHWTGLNSSFHS